MFIGWHNVRWLTRRWGSRRLDEERMTGSHQHEANTDSSSKSPRGEETLGDDGLSPQPERSGRPNACNRHFDLWRDGEDAWAREMYKDPSAILGGQPVDQ